MLRGFTNALRNLLAAFGLVVLVITAVPQVLNQWTDALAGPYFEPRGRILIVLGADQLDTHIIGVSSYWRSVYAGLVWKQGGFQQVLICGGPSHSPVSPLMKDFLIAQGVPAASVSVETVSDSTHENALEASRQLKNDPGAKVLLTSDYHMFRAVRCFRKAGVEVTPVYFPDAAKRATHWQDRWRVFLDLCFETGKIGWYKLHGWI
jgi:uncharacterized SAM-binding protein YcdF (DUF218 family)